MADIDISIGGDNKELLKEVAEAKRVLNKEAREQERIDARLSRKKARNRLKVIRETRKAEEQSARESERMEDRLFRKRARNRLKDIRARVREEKAAHREIERAERLSAERRSRLFRRGVAGAVGTGLAVGAAGVVMGRGIIEYEERLARTAVQAKKSREEQAALGESITAASIKYGVSRDNILSTFEAIVDKSGDFDLAAQNLDKIGMTLRGTGSDASELGILIAALKNSINESGTKQTGGIFDFLDVLIAQGDEASINLSELTSEAQKLMGAFTQAGFENMKQFTEFGGLFQIAGKGAGKAEAATYVASFLREIGKRSKDIEKATGVKTTKKGGTLRDLGDVIPELLKATGGDINKINALFPNAEAAIPLKLLAVEYQKTGGEIKSFNRLLELGGMAAEVNAERYKRVSETSGQAFGKAGALGTMLADKALVPVIDDLSVSLERLLSDPGKLKQLENTFMAIGETLKLVGKFGVAFGNIISPIVGIAGDISRSGQLNERIKKLPETAKKRLKDELGVGFLEPIVNAGSTRSSMNAVESALNNIELSLVVNNTMGRTDAKLEGLSNSDTGSKRFTNYAVGRNQWRFGQ